VLLKADKNELRQKRHLRVRKNVAGTAERPRLNVFRSLKNIYAQVIDDDKGITLASASSLDKDFNGTGGNIAAAKEVDEVIKKGYDRRNKRQQVIICIPAATRFITRRPANVQINLLLRL